jgi:hypothetical protein
VKLGHGVSNISSIFESGIPDLPLYKNVIKRILIQSIVTKNKLQDSNHFITKINHKCLTKCDNPLISP